MNHNLNISIPPMPGEWRGPKHVSPAQEAWLRRYYPENTNRDIMAVMPFKSARTLYLAVEELGLRKTREHRSRVVRPLKITEGQRESGRRCSNRYWQEVKEGKRLNPIAALRQRDPERYADLLRRKSERQKEIIATQRFRLKMGMPVKSGARVALHPYTDAQSSRRWRALHYGYVLAEDCSEQGGHRFVIYYDEETQRHPKFEKNCLKAGFSIRPWSE